MERQSYLWIYKSDNLLQMNPETRNTLMIKQEGKSFLITMCQKNCIFAKWFWLRQWNTRVQSVYAAPGAYTVSWAWGENRSLFGRQAQVFRALHVDRSYLLPGDPTGDITWKRPPKELPVLFLEMQTEEQVCEYLDWTQGFRSKTSRPSSQAGLQAPSMSVLEVRRVACRSGVFFLFTLKALSGVRTVRSQVQLHHGGCQRHGGSPVGASLRGLICAIPFCSSHHGDESAEDQSPESGLILVIC